MKLETVKIISKNSDIRGKSFDVYYYDNFKDLDLVSVESSTNCANLLYVLDNSSIEDIKLSLKDLLLSREVSAIFKKFSEKEISEGFAVQAVVNKVRGYTND